LISTASPFWLSSISNPQLAVGANVPILVKSYFRDCLPSKSNGREGKEIDRRSEIPNPQATGQSELPLRDEFVAGTLQAISELDLGLAKTYSSKKKFLDDLERL